MKKKDLAIIIASVVVATIFSYLICSKFITTSSTRQQKVEVVKPISSDFKLPDQAIFNAGAVNPTKVIQIGPNTNNQPFSKQ